MATDRRTRRRSTIPGRRTDPPGERPSLRTGVTPAVEGSEPLVEDDCGRPQRSKRSCLVKRLSTDQITGWN
jgi:hypothetical protein